MSGGSTVPGGGRQLRNSSMLRRPGRYQEDDGPTRADRPVFVHPDVPFDPNLARHCAFPSLPLNYPGRGPSEIVREEEQKRALAAAAAAWKKQREEAARREREPLGFESDGGSYYGEEPALASPAVSEYQDDENWQPPSRRWHKVLAEESAAQSASHREEEQEEAIEEEDKVPEAAATGPPPGPSATPEAQQTSANFPSRAAHVANIRRREPVRISIESPHIDQEAFDSDTTGNAPLMFGQPPYTDWLGLTDAVKYATIHELTQVMSFGNAVKNLALQHEEMDYLRELIAKERWKASKVKKKIAKHANDATLDWFDKFNKRTDLDPVTSTMTAREIREGKSYLNFMGLKNIAARLGFWQGTGGQFHDIPAECFVEGDMQGVMREVRLAGGEEGERMLRAQAQARKPPVMSKAELFVRMDPPPGTVNPARFRFDSQRAVYPRDNGLPQGPLEGLHPDQYVVDAQSGARYSLFGRSLWPEATRDLGLQVDQEELSVAAVHNRVVMAVNAVQIEHAAAPTEQDAESIDYPPRQDTLLPGVAWDEEDEQQEAL